MQLRDETINTAQYPDRGDGVKSWNAVAVPFYQHVYQTKKKRIQKNLSFFLKVVNAIQNVFASFCKYFIGGLILGCLFIFVCLI